MNKIAKSLSPEQLNEFIAECARTPGLTLETIKKLAAQRGIVVSLMSAKGFRDGPFQQHLLKLEHAQRIAEQVKALQEVDTSITLADASAALLAQRVFEMIYEGEIGPDGELDLDTVSKIIARLQQREQSAKRTEAQLRAYEAREAERKAQAEAVGTDATLTPEAREERIREIFNVPTPPAPSAA